MKRLTKLYLVAAFAALLTPALANAAPRMYVGFHDDPNFRYETRRAEMLDQVRSTHATIVRTLVTWPNIAATRPSNAADPFDPAYNFNDLDEFVRNAQVRDMEVIITLWGTPKWANGGKTPNFMPTKLSDFTAFARAVASRYSGRYPGIHTCGSSRSGTSRTYSSSWRRNSMPRGSRSRRGTTRSWRPRDMRA